MINVALYEHLGANAGITALTDKIYPTVRPLRIDPPFIVYTQDEDTRLTLADGTESAYRQAIFSIDCYATTLASAIAIADAVESALKGHIGSMGTSAPVDVDHVRVERRGPNLFEGDTELHRVPLEFLIGYEE